MRALLPVRAARTLLIRTAASGPDHNASHGTSPSPRTDSTSQGTNSSSSSKPVRPPRRLRGAAPPLSPGTMKRGKGTIESFFPSTAPKKARPAEDPNTKENVLLSKGRPTTAKSSAAAVPKASPSPTDQSTALPAANAAAASNTAAAAAAAADHAADYARAAAAQAINAATDASTSASAAQGGAATAGAAATAGTAAATVPKQPPLAFSKLMAASRAQKHGGLAQQQQQGGGAAVQARQLSAQELTEIAERNTAQAQQAIAAAAAAHQQPQLADLLTEPSWRTALAAEFGKPYMSKLQAFVADEWAHHKVFPPQQFVFRAFNSCPIDQVRVVILGQDPYHNDGQAMGLSFSVPPGQAKPSSLQNIFKELTTDLGCRVPNHGSLEKWSHQGVLLLNASLTVRAHTPNSHSKRGWESLTSAALKVLSSERSGIVFLLWGKFAQDRAAVIDTSKHRVLKAAHPSGLSANKGFFGCKHFSKTNELLGASGLPQIDWQIDDVARR